MPFHEIFAGIASSVIISPVMTLIDMSIIRSQMNRQSISKSFVSNITFYSVNKSKIWRPVSIIFGVYSATYCTANLTELFCHSVEIDHKIPTLLMTSLVNIIAINYKDITYSKMLQNQLMKFSWKSKLLFASRDILTITSCFVWKKDMISYLDKYMMHNKSVIISSLVLPSFIQVFSTPIHILAVDIYQNPNITIRSRWKNIQKSYSSVLTGRIMRVIPAFCIGSFINDMLRPMR